MQKLFVIFALSQILLASSVHAQAIESVLAHPPFDTNYACSEHAAGTLKGLGDELGQDCVVKKFVTSNGRLWLREYDGTGEQNADWYSWERPILSPCDGVVTKIVVNPVTNLPGILGTPPASFIVLKRDDNVYFVLAHVQAVSIKLNERVVAGQVLAKVGNNGYSRSPHIHIGAWRDQTAMQIRWDQRKMKSE